MSEFHFCSISWVWIKRFWLNFAHALISTRSSFGLLHINFFQFGNRELQPWLTSELCFHSKSLEEIDGFWQNLQVLWYMYLQDLSLWHAIWFIYYRVMALVWDQNFCQARLELDCHQNFVYTQYHEKDEFWYLLLTAYYSVYWDMLYAGVGVLSKLCLLPHFIFIGFALAVWLLWQFKISIDLYKSIGKLLSHCRYLNKTFFQKSSLSSPPPNTSHLCKSLKTIGWLITQVSGSGPWVSDNLLHAY